jgi:hypothetical protein
MTEPVFIDAVVAVDLQPRGGHDLRTMHDRMRVRRTMSCLLACAIGASPVGCSTSYMPKTPGRVAVISQGGTPAYVRDGKIYEGGIFGGDLEEAVRGNPGAEDHARAYRSGMTGGFVAVLLGAAGMISGVVVVGDSATKSGGSSNSNESQALVGGGLLVGGLAAYITGFVLMMNAQPHMLDAVNVYNDGTPNVFALPPSPLGPRPVDGAAPGFPIAQPPAPGAPAASPTPAAPPIAPAPSGPSVPPAPAAPQSAPAPPN